MKPSRLIRAMMASLLTLGIGINIVYYNRILNRNEVVLAEQLFAPAKYDEKLVDESFVKEEELSTQEETNQIDTTPEEIAEERVIVYDDMTMEELTAKIDRFLSSDLAGMGYAYAKYSIELGVDPYLAVAISMHETGCSWDCSYLAKECNNIGGQKGSGCGEYQAFDSLENGIYEFILNIKNKYVDYGLLTADEMNSKYAEDPTWSSKVNKYIEKIRNA
ncbi:MAG: glucosaminidase domain-containing protein [Bacilli bacterium]